MEASSGPSPSPQDIKGLGGIFFYVNKIYFSILSLHIFVFVFCRIFIWCIYRVLSNLLLLWPEEELEREEILVKNQII